MGWFNGLRGKKRNTPKAYTPLRRILRLEILEEREAPSVTPLYVYGAADGNAPLVQVYNANTQQLLTSFFAFSSNSRSGVSVAVGDVNGDGQDDIICGAGKGSEVRVFDGSTGQIIRDFFAFPSSPSGGVVVASGDVNGDGKADIVVGAGRGELSYVGVFDGATSQTLRLFQAFADNGRGGVSVAVGDVNGDGRDDIIVGSGPSAQAQINVYNGFTGQLIVNIANLDPGFNGGVSVTAADFPLQGRADIVAGTRNSARLEFSLIDGVSGQIIGNRFLSSAAFGSGINVSVANAAGDAAPDLIVSGRQQPVFQVFSGTTFAPLSSIVVGPEFRLGVTVASGTTESLSNQATSQEIRNWIAVEMAAIMADRTSSAEASRELATMSIAMYDAIASIYGGYDTYVFDQKPTVATDARTAAAAAAFVVLTTLHPSQQDLFTEQFVTTTSQIPDTTAKQAGAVWGQAAATAVLAARLTDNSSSAPFTFTPGTDPGDWSPTSSGPYQVPGWGFVTPFALTSGAQLRPSGPPALTSEQYTEDFNEVQSLGKAGSTTRSADQTQTALFWADPDGTSTSVGHWNAIASLATLTTGQSLLQTARTFAMLNTSLADAAIAAWDAKLVYQFWRPETAIQGAGTDNNPNTTPDPTWSPLVTTPPTPDYVSNQSAYAGAAATVLSSLFGNSFSFSSTSSDGTITRSYSSFAQAAQEAGRSQIYAGTAFQTSNLDGLTLGEQVGALVTAGFFKSA